MNHAFVSISLLNCFLALKFKTLPLIFFLPLIYSSAPSPLCLIIPLKKGIMFFTYITRFVCLSVCLSVITFTARWLDLATWRQVRSILFKRTWKCNTSQDDPFPFPFNMDHRYKITFWPVTLKLMNGFTPNFTCM